MADLPYIQQRQEVSITGQDSTGNQVNYVSADANGNLFVKDYADGATGSAVPSVTMQVGGSDGTNLRTLSTDTSGRLKVLLNDASGNALNSTSNALNVFLTNTTVAVTQSTSPWITQDNADGPVAPGTVASKSILTGGQYNSTLPTLSTGQQAAIQVDSSGRLWSNVTNLPATVDTNYGTVGASTIRTAAEIGNSTGAANFNAGATGAQTLRTASNLYDSAANGITSTAINAKQRLDINLPSEGQSGSAVPFDTVQVGGSDGTNLRALSTDTSGRLKLAGSSYFHPVYTTRVQSTTGVTTVLSTSVSATFTNPTKAGNTIIVIAAVNAGTLTVTDSASQAYSTATTIAGNATQTFKIFYFPNTAAGVTSVTISSTSSTDLNLIALEYSGLLTASPLDQTSTHGQTAATTWTSNSTTTTAQASELLIGGVMGTLHANGVFTPPAPWNSVATVLNTRGGANLELQMADQNVSATGTYAYTGTMTGNANDDMYAAIATFKFVTPNTLVQANTPFTIKSSTGIFRRMIINTIGTGSASVTFYDNTTNSGTIIANISLTGQVNNIEYNLVFNTGLTMVVNSTSADLTVIYD